MKMVPFVNARGSKQEKMEHETANPSSSGPHLWGTYSPSARSPSRWAREGHSALAKGGPCWKPRTKQPLGQWTKRKQRWETDNGGKATGGKVKDIIVPVLHRRTTQSIEGFLRWLLPLHPPHFPAFSDFPFPYSPSRRPSIRLPHQCGTMASSYYTDTREKSLTSLNCIFSSLKWIFETKLLQDNL